MTKTKKVWALISGGGGFYDAAVHRRTLVSRWGVFSKGRIVPATLTYELPAKRKGKR